jgi:hypothetical protein
MFRRRSCIAFAVMLVSTAHAADETLTLACEGTKTETSRYGGYSERREAISLGIIINFAARTVTGFPPDVEVLVRPVITDISETTISFTGSSDPTATVSYSMTGTINRVTGAMEAGLMSFPKEGYGLIKWILREIIKWPREAGDPPLLGPVGDSLDDF